MANAGYSPDCKLLSKMIKDGTQLKYDAFKDSAVVCRIKDIMNRVVFEDKISYFTYNSKTKLEHHSAWIAETKALIKINQLRQKYWYFSPIK